MGKNNVNEFIEQLYAFLSIVVQIALANMHFEFPANFIFLDQGANIFSLTDSRGAAAAATTVNSS